MDELFVAMLKEEWRIHSSMFGNVGFALFPVMLLVFSALGSLALPLFLTLIPGGQVALFTHGFFVLLGVMVGSFGILGREFMNRRFGQASLVAYSSRSLPVSERRIFFTFVVKDAVYYFFLWVLPFVAGFALASPVLGVNLRVAATLLLTLPLAFLTGLSGAFFLSTVYAHSVKLLVVIFVAAGAGFLLIPSLSGVGPAALVPAYVLFSSPSAEALLVTLAAILIPSVVSVVFVRFDYPDRTKRFDDAFTPLARALGNSAHAPFVAKDALDLLRSEGGVGKIIFSFLLPLCLIWIFLSVLIRFIPGIDATVVFAVLLGVISSTTYNWLTEFDTFSAYTFLPVEVGSVLRSKVRSYAFINLVSVGVLGCVVAGTGAWETALPALAAFLSVSAYALAVTIFLTGLHPNVLLYHSKTFFLYLAAISPVLLGLIFLSVLNPACTLGSVVLLPVAWILFEKSVGRWNAWDMPQY
jgi:hypothetical protein